MRREIQVGYAATEITPPSECPLVGYFQREDLHARESDGVLDSSFCAHLCF